MVGPGVGVVVGVERLRDFGPGVEGRRGGPPQRVVGILGQEIVSAVPELFKPVEVVEPRRHQIPGGIDQPRPLAFGVE